MIQRHSPKSSQKAPYLTCADKLRDAIEERCINGVIRPGTRLDETELARQFGVSRTPVREALIELTATGLVVMGPRRSMHVAELTPLRLLEMFEVLAELEAMCGRRAARRMSEADRAAIMGVYKACEAAFVSGDLDAYFTASERFHRFVCASSHAEFIVQQSAAMRRRLRPHLRLQLRIRDRMRNSFEEYTGIMDALLASDPELSADRLRAHVMVQGDRCTDLLAALASLGSVPAASELVTA